MNYEEAFINPDEYAHDSKGNIIGVTPDGKVHKVTSFENFEKEDKTKLRVIK